MAIWTNFKEWASSITHFYFLPLCSSKVMLSILIKRTVARSTRTRQVNTRCGDIWNNACFANPNFDTYKSHTITYLRQWIFINVSFQIYSLWYNGSSSNLDLIHSVFLDLLILIHINLYQSLSHTHNVFLTTYIFPIFFRQELSGIIDYYKWYVL